MHASLPTSCFWALCRNQKLRTSSLHGVSTAACTARSVTQQLATCMWVTTRIKFKSTIATLFANTEHFGMLAMCLWPPSYAQLCISCITNLLSSYATVSCSYCMHTMPLLSYAVRSLATLQTKTWEGYLIAHGGSSSLGASTSAQDLLRRRYVGIAGSNKLLGALEMQQVTACTWYF